jgi:hypothetical protein
MALKIVGRSSRFMRVSEHKEKPQEAKGATLHCDGCGNDFGVIFPSACTSLKRQQLIKAAADEHRKIGCTVGMADERRVYQMNYARK